MPDKNAEKFINNAALDALIGSHDGDMALLYLYLIRNGELDKDDAARQLCRTMSEISAAEEKLKRLDISFEAVPSAPVRGPEKASAQAEADTVQEPDSQIPQYSSEEIVRRTRADGVFSGLISECAKVIGHSLSSADIKMLFGIYDYLAIPPEVIMELLNYCGEITREKFGSGRRPSMRAIEKQAYSWARLELLTLEQAEIYIKDQRRRRSLIAKMKAVLGIRDRQLSSGETKYISSWLDMGFGEEAIAIAYDRTVTSTGSMKWSYMNKILLNWHEKNLHSAREINEKDSRRSRAQAQAPQQPASQSIDMEKLRDAVNKI